MSAIRPISDLQFGVANTEIGVIQALEPGPRIMRYELTDFEWTAIGPFLPNKPRGVPRVNDRRVLNGIFWILRSGAPWRDLPELWALHDLLQPARSLADGWRLGHANFGIGTLVDRYAPDLLPNTTRCDSVKLTRKLTPIATTFASSIGST